MYKLRRFYNQNRERIIKTILIIVFIIGGIQLLNYFAKNNTKTNNVSNNTTIKNVSDYDEVISDESLISGKKVSTTKLQNDSNKIKEFVEFCNNKDINSAYDLLTKVCKEEMFPTIQDFYNIYYKKIFNNERRVYTIENWTGNTYQIRFTEDILSTGNLNANETKQDYITITREDGEDKLNINSYIGRENSNKITENKDIEVTVTSIDKYMDYEIYNLSIKNNSDNTILLDVGNDPKSIYLLDNNDMKYYFYDNEIVENRLIIQSQFTNTLQIKFNNSYTSSRKIKNLVFSKLVFNYDEYLNLDNNVEFEDFYEFRIEV